MNSEQNLPELDAALVLITRGVHNLRPEDPIYLFGSLAKRLAVFRLSVGRPVTLEEYLEKSPPDLKPRLNPNGKFDIDLAIPEDGIPWSEWLSLANNVMKNCRGIEVDPHLVKLDRKGFIVEKIVSSGEMRKFQIHNGSYVLPVGPEDERMMPLDIMTLRAYQSLFAGLERPKDNADILNQFLLGTAYTGALPQIAEIIEETPKKMGNRTKLDVLRFYYRNIVPKNIRKEVSRIRQWLSRSDQKNELLIPRYF